MRIAFDAKRYFNNSTGLGNFSREVVHSLCRRFPDEEFILFSETAQEFSSPCHNLSLFVPESPGFLWRSLGIAADAAKLGVDVFHGLSNELPKGLRKAGIHSVVTIHDVIFKRFPGYYPFFDRRIYHFKTKYALKHADIVVAASKTTAEDLSKFYDFQGPVKVVYQPVHPDFYDRFKGTNGGASTPYFLYVSGFSDRKNHAILVEAFSYIAKQCDWDLVLAGSAGSTLENLRSFIEHEKLGHRIRIMTDVPQHDLVFLMKQASAFVYPSLFEGFGIPLAEAAVCGLPMAVSDIPVFRELAENGALYFHPNNSREIAEAMIQLTHPEYTGEIMKHRLNILKKIEPAVIADRYMEIYRSLI